MALLREHGVPCSRAHVLYRKDRHRTEIPFMVRSSYPDTATQTAIYRGILDQANGRPVSFS